MKLIGWLRSFFMWEHDAAWNLDLLQRSVNDAERLHYSNFLLICERRMVEVVEILIGTLLKVVRDDEVEPWPLLPDEEAAFRLV